MKERKTAVAIAVLLTVILVPGVAHADDLGSLMYLIFVWPLGILVVITLAVLMVVLLVRGHPSPRLGLAVTLAGIIGGLGYPVVGLSALYSSYGPRKHDPLLIVASLLPVVLLSVVGIAMGLWYQQSKR